METNNNTNTTPANDNNNQSSHEVTAKQLKRQRIRQIIVSLIGVAILVWGIVKIGCLASLIIGETLVGKRTMLRRILGVVFGSCLYRFIVAVALRFNVPAAAMKLVSAIIVAVAISMPAIREHFAFEKRRHAARARRTVTNREGQ